MSIADIIAVSNQPMIIHLPQNHLTRTGEKLAISVSRDDIVLFDQ